MYSSVSPLFSLILLIMYSISLMQTKNLKDLKNKYFPLKSDLKYPTKNFKELLYFLSIAKLFTLQIQTK